MIQILHKEDCCGCSACAQVCPHGCIRMTADREGFVYPEVDPAACVNCGLCEKICPWLHQYDQRQPKRIEAVVSKDDHIRMQSSSGGCFSELATWVIRKGGVVWGACFTKDWSVEHRCIETLEGLSELRGSKYVQSRIGDAFLKIRSTLKTGRWVLFSGTSCQISGLKHFLRNQFSEHLLLVEVVCHGVPSPLVWKEYLKILTGNQIGLLYQVQFRNKTCGWKSYHVVYAGKNFRKDRLFLEDPYMQCFIRNVSLRPSCFQCKCKSFATGSDFVLADYWGIQHLQPELDDDKGTGLVFILTEQAEQIWNELNLHTKQAVGLENLLRYNPSIVHSSVEPKRRTFFFAGLKLGIPLSWLFMFFAKDGVKGRLKKWIHK